MTSNTTSLGPSCAQGRVKLNRPTDGTHCITTSSHDLLQVTLVEDSPYGLQAHAALTKAKRDKLTPSLDVLCTDGGGALRTEGDFFANLRTKNFL